MVEFLTVIQLLHVMFLGDQEAYVVGYLAVLIEYISSNYIILTLSLFLVQIYRTFYFGPYVPEVVCT